MGDERRVRCAHDEEEEIRNEICAWYKRLGKGNRIWRDVTRRFLDKYIKSTCVQLEERD